jgi:hypothetical protein
MERNGGESLDGSPHGLYPVAGLNKHRGPLTLWVVAFLALAAAPDADAYIDPGTGTLAVQALLSAFFGALFFGRKAIRGMLRTVGRALRPRAATKSVPLPGSEERPD